ncbi:MAG TPA: pentapeptide repeat-containing protein [Candidatus Obscuribacterales bacterium]
MPIDSSKKESQTLTNPGLTPDFWISLISIPAIPKALRLPIFAGGIIVFLLWLVQYSNAKNLEQKITTLEQQIDGLPVENFPKDKLTLKKDLLIVEKDQVNAKNAIYGTLIQALGAVFFATTAYFTYRNVKATEEKQVTERFSNAVELLGNDNLAVRLGGIYALERIAKDSEKDYWTIMEVLTGFVRERSKLRREEQLSSPPTDIEEQLSSPPTDIQAVLTIINRRAKAYSQGEKDRLELSGLDFSWMVLTGVSFKDINLKEANFHKANLGGANFGGADLSKADLTSANLNGADLNGADLSFAKLFTAALIKANLSGADLNGADLSQADLTEANLSGATLSFANLTEADLTETKLDKANLSGANFGGADLFTADLTETNLYRANLNRAKLIEANLSQANLNGANLSKANLSGANLIGANLTKEQMDSAITDENTKLPTYLLSPQSSQPDAPAQ